MEGLETSLIDVSNTSIDDLFDETPAKTPTAEDLIAGKKPEPSEVVEIKPKEDKKIEQKVEDSTIDDLFETDVEEVETKIEDKSSDKSEKKKSPKDNKPEVDYKSVYDYYVETGKWQPLDKETLEQIEWTDENFQNLWDYQWENQIGDGINQLVDSTGPYGKAIISYAQNGGNPEEIIDLFKEQKKLESIDITSEGGQKEMVSNYYKSLGWTDQKIAKHIQRLEVEGEDALKGEAEEVKTLHDESIKGKVEEKNKAQEEYAKAEEVKEKKFQANIVNTLKTRTDLTPTEKQEIHKGLLNYDKKLPNGNLVNQFYIDFQEFIADPNNYVDMYQFIKDKDKFLSKIEKKVETKVTAKQWKFLKNGGAVSNKGGGYATPEVDTKDDFKFNYK